MTLFLLVSGEKFVAATIQLDKLEKNDVLKILKVLEPYESNINLLTKKDLSPGVDLGSLGVGLKDSAEVSIKLWGTFGLCYYRKDHKICFYLYIFKPFCV